jgi:hypothetical protein
MEKSIQLGDSRSLNKPAYTSYCIYAASGYEQSPECYERGTKRPKSFSQKCHGMKQ